MIADDEDSRHGNPIMPPWPPDREYSTFLDEQWEDDKWKNVTKPEFLPNLLNKEKKKK